MRWAGHVARIGEKRNMYRLLVGKPDGKRPLGRPRRRWIDNIKMDLLEIGLNVLDWIGLAQDRYRWRALVSSVMNFRVPLNAGNCRMAAQLVASRVVLGSTELVSYIFVKIYKQNPIEISYLAVLQTISSGPNFKPLFRLNRNWMLTVLYDSLNTLLERIVRMFD
jgi:hypothetical protein